MLSSKIWLGGTEVTSLTEDQMRVHRRQVQMVFQDPYSSLNPRMRVGQIVAEPLENYGLAEGACAPTGAAVRASPNARPAADKIRERLFIPILLDYRR